MLLREKADQVRGLQAETGLGCRLIFVHETGLHPDPGFELVVGADVAHNSAFLFGAGGERVARLDAANVRSTGGFGEVVGYDEGVRGPLLEALRRVAPRTARLPPRRRHRRARRGRAPGAAPALRRRAVEADKVFTLELGVLTEAGFAGLEEDVLVTRRAAPTQPSRCIIPLNNELRRATF
jgi:hypothetical protein